MRICKFVPWCLPLLLAACLETDDGGGNSLTGTEGSLTPLIGAWDNTQVDSGTDWIIFLSTGRFQWFQTITRGMTSTTTSISGSLTANADRGNMWLQGTFNLTVSGESSTNQSSGPFDEIYAYQVSDSLLSLSGSSGNRQYRWR